MLPDTPWAELDLAGRRLVEELFHAALSLPARERAAFIRSQVGNRTTLLRELEGLLTAYYEQESSGGWRHPLIEPDEFEQGLTGRRIGSWRIERLLGEGGMGAVYLASRTRGEFEQTAALKMVSCRLANSALQERFRQERQILARLNHPHIARLLDGGTTEDGDPYLVMEYVEGTPFDEYCDQHHLPLRRRLELYVVICSAVHYAHQNLVVHRDLKPDNILVTGDGTPKLLDFGTAKLLAEQIRPDVTQKGFRAFTPAYASPEEILGHPVTTASDVYSLGVVLYRVLAGVPPYELQDYSTGELLRVVCQQEPLRPSIASRNGAELRGDLDAIVLKAMRKEPAARYSSVDQLADDIQRYLGGRPVRARQGNLQYRALKFVRRNWVPVAAGAMLFFTLAAGVSGMLWQARKAQARYHDLRRLTNSLLFELHDVVQQLPGSTAAQRLLVTRAIDHLDKLATEIKGDLPLQGDLVEAYLKLGNLQGNPYEPNIGDVEGALESLSKALSLANEIQREQPGYPGAARAEQAIGEVLFGMGRTQEAINHTRNACTSFEDLAARTGAVASSFYQAASCYDTLGDQYGQTGTASLGDRTAARASYEKAIALNTQALQIEPGFVRSRRAVAINRMKIGQMVVETDPEEAVLIFRDALGILDSLPPEEKEKIENRRARSVLSRRVAGALVQLADYDGAVAEYQRALSFVEPIAAVDPHNSRAQFDLAVALNDLSLTYEQMGSTAQALRTAEHVRQVLSRVQEKDPENQVWRGHMADLLVRMSALIQNDPGRAEKMAREGISVAKELAERPDAHPIDLNRAAQALSLVAFPHLRDPRLAVQYARRCVERSGGRAPEFLRTLAVAHRVAGDREAARHAALQGLALLPQPGPGARPSLIRKLLEEEIR
jgi:tetratricopeptide (TPR) repeat protein